MNKRRFLYIIVFTLLGSTMVSLLITGRITLFLHERMVKYVIFAVLVLGVLLVYQMITTVKELKEGKKIDFEFGYSHLLFLIPFALFIINPTKISAEVIENKNTDFFVIETSDSSTVEEDRPPLTTNEETTEIVALEDPTVEDASDISISQETGTNESSDIETLDDEGDSSSSEEESSELSDDVLEIPITYTEIPIENGILYGTTSETNDLFMQTVIDLDIRTDDILGQSIALEGFVFKDDYFEDNQFVIGRLWITCCAADASIAGLMCVSDIASEIEVDSWVRVEGRVNMGEVYYPYTDSMMQIYMIENPEIYVIEPYDSQFVTY